MCLKRKNVLMKCCIFLDIFIQFPTVKVQEYLSRGMNEKMCWIISDYKMKTVLKTLRLVFSTALYKFKIFS